MTILALIQGAASIESRADTHASEFSYQGQIKLDGTPLDGMADFRFALWDAETAGLQVGEVIELNEVNVENGLFNVVLNQADEFGPDAFNGDARWLQIEVRSPAGSGVFSTLAPRQAITATPYAINTRGMYVDGTGKVNIGQNVFDSSLWGVTITPSGLVGIRNTEPTTELEVAGVVKADVFVGDGSGLENLPVTEGVWTQNGSNIHYSDGNVGIGPSAAKKLHIGSFDPGSEGMIRLQSRSSTGSNTFRTWDIGVPEAGTDATGVGYSFVIDDEMLGTDPEFMVKWGTGNVGIGTVEPTQKLHVAGGNIRADRGEVTSGLQRALILGGARGGPGAPFAFINFQNYDDNDSAVDYVGAQIRSYNPQSVDSGDLRFFTKSSTDANPVNRMTITADGNVNAGGTITAAGFAGDGSGLTNLSGANWTENGSDIYYNDGNVGIGTNTPTTSLDVGGSARVSGDLHVDRGGAPFAITRSLILGGARDAGFPHFAEIDFQNFDNGATAQDYVGARITSTNVSGDEGGDLVFFTKPTVSEGGALAVRMRINSNGNVGIGTTAPAAQLDVRQPAGAVVADAAIRAEHLETTGINYGMYASSASNSGYGVYGEATSGTGSTYGVYGRAISNSGWGVYANGRIGASGTKSFVIDHPQKPTEEFLLHYSSESPEPLNTYSGTVTLGTDGAARVRLPDYFESINIDFRYQLTAIGAAAPNLHVAQEITNNAFRIAGGQDGLKVSWQVTARRNDEFVKQFGAPIEVQKNEQERGKYVMPQLYGQPEELGIHYGTQGPLAEKAVDQAVSREAD